MESEKLWRVTVLLLVVAAIVAAGSYWLRRDDATATQPLATTEPASGVPAAAASVAPASSSASPACPKTLLDQEPILTRNGITLFMGHSVGEAGVRLAQRCHPVQLDSVVALTVGGVQPLTAEPGATNATVPWGCAKEIPAIGMRAAQPIEQDDMPVASGAQVQAVLQWTPAVQSDTTIQCAAPRSEFQSEEQRLYQIATVANRWLVEAWRPAVDPLETPQDAGKRPVPRVFVVSSVSAANECKAQDSAESKGSGQPARNPGQYRRIYGVLKAKDSEEEKSWMIFESGSDEARAVVAVPLDPAKGQLQPGKQDAWFYSGC